MSTNGLVVVPLAQIFERDVMSAKTSKRPFDNPINCRDACWTALKMPALTSRSFRKPSRRLRNVKEEPGVEAEGEVMNIKRRYKFLHRSDAPFGKLEELA
jgi:hypothetical protein